jgi:mono/diheme cytochrome c family protein
MKKNFSLLFVLLLALTVVLTACGGGGGESSDSAAKAGEELFAQTVIGSQAGCITCHSLEAGVVIVGPSMDGIGNRSAEFLRESILDPDANLADGFPAGTMPQVWGDELTDEQVDQLVAYMLTLK